MGDIPRWTDATTATAAWPRFVRLLRDSFTDVLEPNPLRARFVVGEGDLARPFLAWSALSPGGRPWAVLAIHLGNHTLLRKRAALTANLRLPVGGLALFRDVALLRQTIPIDAVDLARLRIVLDGMERTVQMLVAAAAPDVPPDTPFAYVFTAGSCP